MKITPRKGYVLVSKQDLVEEKKVGSIILPEEDNKKTYVQVESEGEVYSRGDSVFTLPFSTKMQIEDNLFLMEEKDIVAKFTL